MNQLSDKVVSLLRTVVPVAWGALVTWLLTIIPLPTPVTGFLSSQTSFIVALVIAAWYFVFRWIEPKMPPWLTRLVLGSSLTPSYAPVTYRAPGGAVNSSGGPVVISGPQNTSGPGDGTAGTATLMFKPPA